MLIDLQKKIYILNYYDQNSSQSSILKTGCCLVYDLQEVHLIYFPGFIVEPLWSS